MADKKLNPKDYPKPTADEDIEIRLSRGQEVHWDKKHGGPVVESAGQSAVSSQPEAEPEVKSAPAETPKSKKAK